jgi:HEAT repeat protein
MGVQGVDDDAAYSLAGIGPAAAPLLAEALSSPEEAVRRRAMVAIALIGPWASAGREVLIRCLGNPQETPDFAAGSIVRAGKDRP